MNGKQVIKMLKKRGRHVIRINGSHYRLGKQNVRTMVLVYGKRDLGVALINAIEQQTGEKLT